jgi:hypothetical protein
MNKLNISEEQLCELKKHIPDEHFDEIVYEYKQVIDDFNYDNLKTISGIEQVAGMPEISIKQDLSRTELKSILPTIEGHLRKSLDNLKKLSYDQLSELGQYCLIDGSENHDLKAESYSKYQSDFIMSIETHISALQIWTKKIEKMTGHKDKPIFLTSRVKDIWEKYTDDEIVKGNIKSKTDGASFVETLRIVLAAAGFHIERPSDMLELVWKREKF